MPFRPRKAVAGIDTSARRRAASARRPQGGNQPTTASEDWAHRLES